MSISDRLGSASRPPYAWTRWPAEDWGRRIAATAGILTEGRDTVTGHNDQTQRADTDREWSPTEGSHCTVREGRIVSTGTFFQREDLLKWLNAAPADAKVEVKSLPNSIEVVLNYRVEGHPL